MKARLTGTILGILLCTISVAQDTNQSPSNGAPSQGQGNPVAIPSAQSPSGQVSDNPRIAPGSIIPVQLSRSVDAKKVKTGDEVEAKVTQDLKAGNGEVIVPKETKVIGHVTEAQMRNKEQKESRVGIDFDHAIMKNGEDVPLPMSIQAIIAAPSLNAGNNAGGESAAPSAPSAGGYGSGRSAGMPSQAPSSPPTGAEQSDSGQTGANVRQSISASTQGVVGISNLKLSMVSNTTPGSVVSSEKSNVKLESGTLMLLRVKQ
jgi:hypothetical protein